MTSPFRSASPRVRLVKHFSLPVRNAMATARTCYSASGLVDEEALLDRDKYMGLAKSVYEAGHHTVFQHAHFQFALDRVSRQFLWSFLHAHPFYNSEQVSQRYVAVKEENVTVPELKGRAARLYRECVARQFEEYRALCGKLAPLVESAYRERFPASERHAKRDAAAVAKRAQEVARYVLPVACHAFLYHTVSGLTVMRYLRAARQFDCPSETLHVAERMAAEMRRADPDFETLLERPLESEAMPEEKWLRRDDLFSREARIEQERQATLFVTEFDRDFRRLGPRLRDAAVPDHARAAAPTDPASDLFPDLFGAWATGAGSARDAATPGGWGSASGRGGGVVAFETARLVAWTKDAERLLARAVRQVLGLPSATLSDDEALALALDPEKNSLLGETLNLTTLHKLTRALVHPHYTFLKRLSHTADSQDQRHRMVPASRPFLVAHLTGRPDYVVPGLVREDPRVERAYRDSMARTWEAVRALRREGVADEWVAYLLPNAVTVRFAQSGDLLNLRHKFEMRLCYNAQEEIWRASVEEAAQIAGVHPRIGRWLLPPCAARARGGRRPYCPEGPRHCGARVWALDPADYARRI